MALRLLRRRAHQGASMMQFLDWLEHSPLSMWIKESESLWPYDIFCLSMHSVGMSLFVGFSTALALRGLGYAPRVPFDPLRRFLPVVYAGFWMAVVSGIGLFITYPVKAVRNPVFWIKMIGVVVAVACVRQITREFFGHGVLPGSTHVSERARRASFRLLTAWFVTISAGRMLAYEGIPSIEWVAAIGMAILGILTVVVFVLTPGLRPSVSAASSLATPLSTEHTAAHTRDVVRG